MPRLDLQGHRGARGLKPENTFPSFEAALDAGVTSIETDIHLTADGVPVLFHDAVVSPRLCERLPEAPVPDPADRPLISRLSLEQLRGYRAAANPDPARFARQDNTPTPVALAFAKAAGVEAYTIPRLVDLFAFAAAYAGELGAAAGKPEDRRAAAAQVVFDLELKRVPFHPETIGDGFDGVTPGRLEVEVVQAIHVAGVLGRTRVRGFDHRSVRAVRQVESALRTGVVVAETAPVDPVALARAAGAQMYCPDYAYLDEGQVRRCRAEGIAVVPWTVNDAPAWETLLAWGVDGITTDYPDELAAVLQQRGFLPSHTGPRSLPRGSS